MEGMDLEIDQASSLCSTSDAGTGLTDFDSAWSDDDFDSDDEEKNWPKVRCLSSFAHLERLAIKSNVRLTKETNRRLLYLTLQKIGPITAQKLIKKLVQKGGLDWGEEEDEVEAILDYGKDEDGRDLYLIKWKGWTNEHNTWEPVHHINCPELIEEFHKLNKEAELANPNSAIFKSVRKPLKWGPAYSRPSSSQISELLDRLEKVQGNITPLQLLKLHDPSKLNKGRMKEVMYGGGRVKRKTQTRSRNITNKRSAAYKKLKAEVQLAIKRWENHMNSISTDPASITVENTFDLEGPPGNFTYINDYKEGPGVKIPQDPIIGCECTDCYDERKMCCGHNAGSQFAYYKTGKLRLPPGYPIYECNKHCKCPSTCINRVVQHGRKYRVCIFRTHNNCGWGVKTLQRIKKGSFVMEYVGEVISSEEAERRGKIYDANRHTYLFDLDYNDDDNPFTVDAAFYGNVSHFINHSCDPNLTVYGVWINTLDPGLPRIAFFANRDIAKGEELTFDYLYSGNRNKLEAAENQTGPLDSQMDTTISGNDVQPQQNGETTPADNITLTDSTEQSAINGEVAMEVEPETGETIADPALTSLVNGDINDNKVIEGEEPLSVNGDAVSTDTSKDTPAIETVRSPVRSSFGSPRNVNSPSTNGTGMHSPKHGPSPTPSKIKFRMMCQCGAKNCRKYLF